MNTTGANPKKVLATACAPEAGKTTAKVAAVQILVDDMADDGAPEAILSFVLLIPDTLELVEILLDQDIELGGTGISRMIDPLRTAFHMGSNCPIGAVTKLLKRLLQLGP